MKALENIEDKEEIKSTINDILLKITEDDENYNVPLKELKLNMVQAT